MKIALASAVTINFNVAANIAEIGRYAAEAKRGGCDLICFGEAFVNGFDGLTWDYGRDKEAAIGVNGEAFLTLREIAARNRIAIAFGYYERGGGCIYSSYAVLDEIGGLICNYRRISKGWKELFADNAVYIDGEGEIAAFAYKGVSFAIGLCGDFWDDALAAQARRLNADITLWPVYVSYTKERWEQTERQAYAERAALIGGDALFVNSICEGDALGGCVFYKEGAVAVELPFGKRGLLICQPSLSS